MRKPALAADTFYRRVRTLAVALSLVMVGTVFYAHNVRAESAPQHPRDSLGISTLDVTAARASSPAGEITAAGLKAAAVSTAIAWTSPWGSRPQRQSFIR